MATTEPLPSPPRIGVAAVVTDPSNSSQQQVLLGQRLSSHGHGTYQFPGGHLEHGESLFACAERETLEETGLVVRATDLVAVTNSLWPEEIVGGMLVASKHYVTLFVACEVVDVGREQSAQALEPEKCAGWEWVEWREVCGWVRGWREGVEGARELFKPIVEVVEGRGRLGQWPFEVPGRGGGSEDV